MKTSNQLCFTKMHGLGNDFVVINNLDGTLDVQQLLIAPLANRYTGIGFDQLLIISPAKNADVFCSIFNADGSEAEQCGNGLRCIARYLDEEKISVKKNLQIETKAGVFSLQIQDYDHIQMTLPAPQIENNSRQFILKNHAKVLDATIVSLGNPHAIIKTESLDEIAIEQIGKEIATHSYFPNGTNVGFMQLINPQHIRLRTYERGVGETHACGSNAVAAACTGILRDGLTKKIRVQYRYGSLFVVWEGGKNPVSITGPASKVFEGNFNVDSLLTSSKVHIKSS